MKWLYSTWWKWLCVVLLVYVFIGGFLVPLGPGVTKISPDRILPDSLYTFQLSCYKSNFTSPQAGKVQLWFKSGRTYFCPRSLTIIDSTHLSATFLISGAQTNALLEAKAKLLPPGAPMPEATQFDIVINTDATGTFNLREGFTILKPPANPASLQLDSAYSDTTAGAAVAVLSTADSAQVCDPLVKHHKTGAVNFPYREILYQSIRATFFHVPMWFVMTLMVCFSFTGSLLYLLKGQSKWDTLAHQSVIVALLFGFAGYSTGLLWSKYTWYISTPWADVFRHLLLKDIKLVGAVVGIAIYLAYLILRGSITDPIKKARISAVYNVFAVVIFMMFIFVIPRLTDSLHPGNGGNPAFSKYDLDSTLRAFFYPACIGWILLGMWILSIRMRMRFIQQKQEE